MRDKKVNPNSTELVLIGTSIAAVAATAYFFLGPKGKKHQKSIKDWTVEMKNEVIKKLETAKEISKQVYDEIIDSVAIEYAGMKNIDQAEIKELVKDLKKHWDKFVDLSKERP